RVLFRSVSASPAAPASRRRALSCSARAPEPSAKLRRCAPPPLTPYCRRLRVVSERPMILTRRTLTLGLAAAAIAPAAWAAPALSPDDQAMVNMATAYLQGLDEAKGRFVQTDARG